MAAEARRRTRAADTRAAVLREAEELFAERGYADTRLEDVAERVGVRRAALFYHFDDKRALYEAVLEDVFGTLLARAEAVFARSPDLHRAMEDALSMWVDYVWSRPSTAHLLLREATNRGSHSRAFRRLARPALDMLRRCLDEGERTGVFRPVSREPMHLVSMLAGPTVFFVAAVPALVPDLEFDPLSREQREAHRRDALRAARRLLGLGPRPVPNDSERARRKP